MLRDLVIGLDIGTSSLKLVILDLKSKHIIFDSSKSILKSNIKNNQSPCHIEQDVDVIVELVNELFKEIPVEFYNRLKAFQLCGQMHGLVMWNSVTNDHSSLINWQDGRCSPEFLSQLPIKSKSDLNSGYGCASLYWLALNNQKDYLTRFDMAGTIHDYINYLISNGCLFMSDQNALSWGYFDINEFKWQKDLFNQDSSFPYNLLPLVKKPGFLLETKDDVINLSLTKTKNDSQIIIKNCQIHVALGDLQCSVYSCLENDLDCVINISTSSQICVLIDKSRLTNNIKLPSSISIFPYFGDKILLVGASLNGGNVLQSIVDMMSNFMNDSDQDKLWNKLIQYGTESLDSTSTNQIECKPVLYGERHDKQTYASLTNININNLNIGNLFNSICRGLVQNLCDMITRELLFDVIGCKRLICTGSCLTRNPVLKFYINQIFNTSNQVEILFKSSSDSAIGAAFYLRDIYSNTK